MAQEHNMQQHPDAYSNNINTCNNDKKYQQLIIGTKTIINNRSIIIGVHGGRWSLSPSWLGGIPLVLEPGQSLVQSVVIDPRVPLQVE